MAVRDDDEEALEDTDEESEDEDEDSDDEDEESDDEDDDDDWDDEDESDVIRIVVADEDEESREDLIAGLEEEGYDVIDLGDGEDLGDFLRTTAQAEDDEPDYPSLLIVSENAASEAALELLAEFRQSDWSTPVILMTGNDTNSSEEGERLGLNVIDRPGRGQWLELVKSALGGK